MLTTLYFKFLPYYNKQGKAPASATGSAASSSAGCFIDLDSTRGVLDRELDRPSGRELGSGTASRWSVSCTGPSTCTIRCAGCCRQRSLELEYLPLPWWPWNHANDSYARLGAADGADSAPLAPASLVPWRACQEPGPLAGALGKIAAGPTPGGRPGAWAEALVSSAAWLPAAAAWPGERSPRLRRRANSKNSKSLRRPIATSTPLEIGAYFAVLFLVAFLFVYYSIRE